MECVNMLDVQSTIMDIENYLKPYLTQYRQCTYSVYFDEPNRTYDLVVGVYCDPNESAIENLEGVPLGDCISSLIEFQIAELKSESIPLVPGMVYKRFYFKNVECKHA